MLKTMTNGLLFRSSMPFSTMKSRNRLKLVKLREGDWWRKNWTLRNNKKKRRNSLNWKKIVNMIRRKKLIWNFWMNVKKKSRDRFKRKFNRKKTLEMLNWRKCNIKREKRLARILNPRLLMSENFRMSLSRRDSYNLKRKNKKENILTKC